MRTPGPLTIMLPLATITLAVAACGGRVRRIGDSVPDQGSTAAFPALPGSGGGPGGHVETARDSGADAASGIHEPAPRDAATSPWTVATSVVSGDLRDAGTSSAGAVPRDANAALPDRAPPAGGGASVDAAHEAGAASCVSSGCPPCQLCGSDGCTPGPDGAACTPDNDECTRDYCRGGLCTHEGSGGECHIVGSPISAGAFHNCGILGDHTALCWGVDKDTGVLSSGQATPPSGTAFSAIAAGYDHSCGLTIAGELVCWGANDAGQLDAPPGAGFTQVVSADRFSCALSSAQQAQCWGSSLVINDAAAPPAGVRFVRLAAGGGIACATDTTGRAYCWGKEWTPFDPPPTERFEDISVGGSHVCGLRSIDLTVLCWGHDFGQLDAPAGVGFVQLAAGGAHTCALGVDGIPRCWGSDLEGQLRYPTGSVFTHITASAHHSCGLRQDRTAVCWGVSDGGPLDSGQSVAPEGVLFGCGAACVGS